MNTMAPLNVFDVPLAGINLIEASAGTGKTWTICGLYLRLLLQRGLSVDQILVVTFTNTATAELRERIRARIAQTLRYVTQGPDSSDDHFVGTMVEGLRRADMAGELMANRLRLALHSFDEAAIFTIHGFCQRALADNPFTAGLPLVSELVEDDETLLTEVVHDFWRRHVAADAMTAAFARFLQTRRDSPAVYKRLLRRHLAKPLARHCWPENIEEPTLPAETLRPLYTAARELWLEHAESIVGLLLGTDSLNKKTYTDDAIRSGADEWSRLFRDPSPFGDRGHKTHLYRAGEMAAKVRKGRSAPTHAFFDCAEAYLGARKTLDASLGLQRLRLLRRLFADAGAQLRLLKRSRQLVSFDDMLSNVHDRIKDPALPWLAASLQARFPAALIDEFQDTDPLQFEIFRTIYTDADASVFIVGDPKQAIYSFRHADLHTYLRAKMWAPVHWSLASNQRSSAALLTALNGLFETNPEAFILEGLNYPRVDYGDKPRVEFTDRTESRAPLQLWRLPERGGVPLPKSFAKRAAVDATAAEISRLLSAGADAKIMLGGQPLKARDIAVLVRARALGSDVKRALATVGVGSVELSRSSIYQTLDADELDIVLSAVLSPSRDALVRAALATALIGATASEIEQLAQGGIGLMDRTRQFFRYRDLWISDGFGVMYRRLLAEQCVAARMLSRADGERRLTNLLHLGDNLNQAAQHAGAPEALLRFFRAERDADSTTDAAQLRLESDQNLVHIITVHACKGLEFPIVFCPFLLDGAAGRSGPKLDGIEYHDPHMQPVIDFTPYEKNDPALQEIDRIMKSEGAAESVRLLYVALTRAVHRCYLITGPYLCHLSLNESSRSMLNWLVAGRGVPIDTWLKSTRTVATIDAAWVNFAQAHTGAVDLSPLPENTGIQIAADAGALHPLSTPASVHAVAEPWRLSSYSGLSFGARGEQSAGDYDIRASAPAAGPAPPSVGAEDIRRFPRGASAGECIHAVFETIDFTNDRHWPRAVAAALADHPQNPQHAALPAMLLNMVQDVVSTPLGEGLELRSIPQERRLTELEFTFPVLHLSATALNTALLESGYDMPPLRFRDLEGYLKGFIDLVVEHANRYFILDWKSNYLGSHSDAYAPPRLADVMAEQGYHLQYLLYTIALDRYLRRRLPGYRYERHFGGVLYVFVRGVRPGWASAAGADGRPPPGVYFHRPTYAAIRRLDNLLGSAPPSAAA